MSVPALRLLRQARALTATGSPQRFTCVAALVSPLRGSSGRPYGAANSYSRPPPASGLSGLSRWSWPWSRRCRRRLRFASLRCRFRSLCSLHLHSGRSRSSPPESRRGSLDAPRRVSPSLTLRASRPPSESSSSLFFLVFVCWFVCVIRCRSKRHPCHPRNPWFHSFVSIL